MIHRGCVTDSRLQAQPLVSTDGMTTLCVNGEIYNHKDLRTENSGYEFATASDCEVLSDRLVMVFLLNEYFTPSAYAPACIAIVDPLPVLLIPAPPDPSTVRPMGGFKPYAPM